MSKIILRENASDPDTPSSGSLAIYVDANGAVKAKRDDGAILTLGGGSIARNALTNGTFLFAQRQTPGTLTTYSNTSGRSYCADRWALTNENASVQYRRVDSIAAPETGLGSRYYAELKKITSAGKVAFSQVIEGVDTAPYRGRRARVQFKAKNSVGSHTLRIALLYLNSSGTADSMPATFISAFGSSGVDPTWGTNLVAIAPNYAAANSTASGNGVTATLNSSWRQYGGVFTVPTSAQNLVAVAFSDGQLAADDIVHLSEFGLFEGDDEQPVIVTDIHDEFERCQRFCQKTFAVDTAPAQNVGAASGEFRFQCSGTSPTITRGPSFRFPTPMRATPTVTTYSPAAASDQVRDLNANQNCTSTSIVNASMGGLNIHTTGAATSTAGNALGLHMLLEAEL